MRANSNIVLTTLLAFGLAATTASQPVQSDATVWRYLNTDMAASITQGWRETRTDASVSGQRISIAAQHYEKGLGTHAPGEMVFTLDRQHKRFTVDVGVDDQGGATGSVVFKILLDGREAFDGGFSGYSITYTSKPLRRF